MAKGIYKNRERTERRISAATSILLCALTVLAQIAVTLLLTHLLKEKASFVYGVLQFIGAVVAIRVYLRTGSPSYKLSWMCLLLALPVSGMILFCVWGGTHQAKQLSLKPVPPIPQRESQRMLSDMNQAALSRRLPLVGPEIHYALSSHVSPGISSVNRPSLLPRYSSSRVRAMRSVSNSPPEIRIPRFWAQASSSR